MRSTHPFHTWSTELLHGLRLMKGDNFVRGIKDYPLHLEKSPDYETLVIPSLHPVMQTPRIHGPCMENPEYGEPRYPAKLPEGLVMAPGGERYQQWRERQEAIRVLEQKQQQQQQHHQHQLQQPQGPRYNIVGDSPISRHENQAIQGGAQGGQVEQQGGAQGAQLAQAHAPGGDLLQMPPQGAQGGLLVQVPPAAQGEGGPQAAPGAQASPLVVQVPQEARRFIQGAVPKADGQKKA